MAGFVIVIGGQGRYVGKTSVVCALIAALPERRWTAIKISGHPHGAAVCAVTEEHDASGVTDSARYLAAGAARSLLVCAPEGRLADAMPRVREEIALAEGVILESNSVVELLKPEVFAMVIDPERAEVKASAQRCLERADALLLVVSASAALAGSSVLSAGAVELVPRFRIAPPVFSSSDFVEFVRRRM
jgi:molybdopterin-guanine dinucleotide biosynthesis protein